MTEAAPTHGEMTESDMEPVAAGGVTNGKLDLEPVAKCREHSTSVWIHFPHVELVFLLYAVQGSLATQLEVLRNGDGVLFYVAAIALVRANRVQDVSHGCPSTCALDSKVAASTAKKLRQVSYTWIRNTQSQWIKARITPRLCPFPSTCLTEFLKSSLVSDSGVWRRCSVLPHCSVRSSSHSSVQLLTSALRVHAFFLLPLQVVYPVFVVGMVCRVIFSRVRPSTGGMIFTRTTKDYYYASSGRRCRRFFSRVLEGAWEEESRPTSEVDVHIHDGYP